MSQARAAAAVLAGAVLSFASYAAADPPPPLPPPLTPRADPAPPPPLERRSSVAMSTGVAAVSIGGLLVVSSTLSGVLQATCQTGCNHTPLIIGLASAGGALLAAGIPLILYGAKLVPSAGPALALAPRKPLPAWAGSAGSEGWSFRF